MQKTDNRNTFGLFPLSILKISSLNLEHFFPSTEV